MIEVLAGAGIGFVAGTVLSAAAKRLPNMLFKSWRSEAYQLLDLEEQGIDPGVVQRKHHLLQRAYIPEVACALLSAVVILTFGLSIQSVAMLSLTWGLIILVLIDAEHQLLPDCFVLPLLWLGLIVNQQSLFTRLDDALFGAVAGYMVLWIVLTGFKLLAGREGMGHGDLKMLAMLGAWAGWQLLPLIVLVATVPAAIYGIAAQRLSTSECGPQIPFGPFLALGGFVAMTWGNAIISAYLL